MFDAIRARAGHLPAQLTARFPAEPFTVHRLLGINSKKEYPDTLNRPIPITDGGKLIPGLIA